MARKELLSLGNGTAVGCLMKALLSKRCTIVSKVQDAALTRLLEQSRRYTSESLSNTDTEAILKSAEEEGEGERAGNPIMDSMIFPASSYSPMLWLIKLGATSLQSLSSCLTCLSKSGFLSSCSSSPTKYSHVLTKHLIVLGPYEVLFTFL